MSDSTEKFCRICYGGAEYDELSMPCKCSGTMDSVHENCLKTWIKSSRKLYCELCQYNFKIRVTFSRFSNPLFIACATIFHLLCLCLHKTQYGFHKVLIELIRVLLLAQTYRIYESLFINIFVSEAPKEICIVLEAMFGIPITIVGFILLFFLLNAIMEATGELNGVRMKEVFRTFVLLKKDKHSTPGKICLLHFVGNSCVMHFLLYLPYQIGNFILSGVQVLKLTEGANILTSIMIILFGYFVTVYSFEILKCLTYFNCLHSMAIYVTYAYLVIKSVFFYLMIYFALPLLYGFWLDVCTLPLYSNSFDAICAWQNTKPMESIISHWLLGAVYTSFIYCLLLQMRKTIHSELLRKLLWFKPCSLSLKKKFEKDTLSQFTIQFIRTLIFNCIVAFLMFGVPAKVLLMCPKVNMEWFKRTTLLRFLNQMFVYYVSQRIMMYRWCKYSFKLFGLQYYLLPKTINTDFNDFLENFPYIQVTIKKPKKIPNFNKITYLYCRIFGLYLLAVLSLVGPFLVEGVIMVIKFYSGNILQEKLHLFIFALFLGYRRLLLLNDVILFGRNSAINLLIAVQCFIILLTLSREPVTELLNSWHDIVIEPLNVIPEPMGFISWTVFMTACTFVTIAGFFEEQCEEFFRKSFTILRQQYFILCIVPYVIAHSIVPLLVLDYNKRTFIFQNFYLYYIVLYKIIQCLFLLWSWKTKFKKYYEEVKMVHFSQHICFENYNNDEEMEDTDTVMALTNAPTKLIYKFFKNVL